MSIGFLDLSAATIIWLVVQATVLLGIAALAQALLMRRASAAARHLFGLATVAGLLMLPVLSQIAPTWTLPFRTEPAILHTPPVAPLESPVEQAAPVPSNSNIPVEAAVTREETQSPIYAIAAAIYVSGLVLLLMYWIIERWHLRQFILRARPIEDAEWIGLLSECKRTIGLSRAVRLLKTRERNVPLAFGTRCPLIVVPAIAESWDADRRRTVLLHELAHVARFDCLTHTIALAACATYWFHPAVWRVSGRLRIERELACDDRVIAAGARPRDYAGHLLEIAYSFGGKRAPALAVCMARPHQLEGRMLAALDAARNRRVPSLRTRFAGAVLVLIVLAVIAGVRPTTTTAEEPPSVSDRQWPASPDQPTTLAGARASVQQEVKEVKQQAKELAHLPMDGLKTVRAAVRAAASMVGVQRENLPGTWEIRPTDTKGVVHLRIVEVNSSSGTNVPIEQLEGLTGAQLTGPGGPVQFKVRRDAGTFTFEGVIRSGVGAGTFTFTADPAFPSEMEKRGFTRPTADEQYQMARHDIGYAFIDELTKQGYGKPQTSELVRAGQHGVQAAYLRDMATLGYRLGTLDALITLRDHGVTPTYVRELADNGYKGLAAEKIREARDHGITPEYVRAMRDTGYSSVPIDQLIKVRDHGVTAEYVRAMRDAGYSKLPLDQVVNVRDHGVTAEYVRDMRQLGYSGPVEEMVRARDHGVTVEYVREMAALGYGSQPMDALIRVRDHGVTAEYAKEVKALGYDKLTLDDLVSLRDHGLTAERIRSANARAGTRLPIDLLRSLAR